MKITVDIADFWLDEEQDLLPALKIHVINEVTNRINKSIEVKVTEAIDKAVKSAIEKKISKKLDKVIDEIINSGEVKSRYSSGKNVTVEEWIREHFSNNNWGSISDKIASLAKTEADNLKKRYDLQFATHIVSRMRDNDLLKEDAAKLLLGQSDKQ